LKTNGFVEEGDVDYDGLHTYLPRHPAYRTDKATTKIRPVFDGAAKSKYGPSLNDVLEIRKNFNPDLLSFFMRFRMNRIAWIADIEKAFLNVALQPEYAKAVRFLWPREPENPSSDLIAYKWKRVQSGLSSSPFLLRGSINKHFLSVKSKFPETVEQIEKQLYVDDYLGGADDETTAVKSALSTVFSVNQAYKIHKTRTVRPPSTLLSTRMPFTPWPFGVSLSCTICDRIQYIITPPEPSLGTNKQNKQRER
jgi:hypothetical protein